MDNNLLIVIVIAVLAVVISYFISRNHFNKKLNEYKDGVNQKLDDYKSLDEALHQINESLALIKHELDDDTKELERVRVETAELQELKKTENKLFENVQLYTSAIYQLEAKKENLMLSISTLNVEQKELMGMLDLYSRLDEYTSAGHFEMPDYLYETSTRFAEEIKDVRSQQKEMIKDKNAVTFPEKNNHF
jgi:uncharacterized phage infection (PIP) family protein YhgE